METRSLGVNMGSSEPVAPVFASDRTCDLPYASDLRRYSNVTGLRRGIGVGRLLGPEACRGHRQSQTVATMASDGDERSRNLIDAEEVENLTRDSGRSAMAVRW